MCGLAGELRFDFEWWCRIFLRGDRPWEEPVGRIGQTAGGA
jgi:hypothetical protein